MLLTEAFKTDAFCVSDNQMVINGRQRLFYITGDRNIRA